MWNLLLLRFAVTMVNSKDFWRKLGIGMAELWSVNQNMVVVIDE